MTRLISLEQINVIHTHREQLNHNKHPPIANTKRRRPIRSMRRPSGRTTGLIILIKYISKHITGGVQVRSKCRPFGRSSGNRRRPIRSMCRPSGRSTGIIYLDIYNWRRPDPIQVPPVRPIIGKFKFKSVKFTIRPESRST